MYHIKNSSLLLLLSLITGIACAADTERKSHKRIREQTIEEREKKRHKKDSNRVWVEYPSNISRIAIVEVIINMPSSGTIKGRKVIRIVERALKKRQDLLKGKMNLYCSGVMVARGKDYKFGQIKDLVVK